VVLDHCSTESPSHLTTSTFISYSPCLFGFWCYLMNHHILVLTDICPCCHFSSHLIVKGNCAQSSVVFFLNFARGYLLQHYLAYCLAYKQNKLINKWTSLKEQMSNKDIMHYEKYKLKSNTHFIFYVANISPPPKCTAIWSYPLFFYLFIYSYMHILFGPFLPFAPCPLPHSLFLPTHPHRFQAETVLPSSPILLKRRHK
jgi:hypothetical protein